MIPHHIKRHLERLEESSWANQAFKDSVPMSLKESYCMCDSPNHVGYHTLDWPRTTLYHLPLPERILRAAPGGCYCTNCLLPTKYSLIYVIRNCEGCGRDYVPKPVAGTYPVKYFLCAKCDSTPVRPNRRRRGRVSFG